MTKFRIATWNTQGNSFAEGKLSSLVKFAPDIICLQETGNLYGSIEFPIKSWDCHRGVKVIGDYFYDVIYYPWGENLRCSLATLLKRGAFVGMHSDDVEMPYLSNSEVPPLDVDYWPIIDPCFQDTRPMLSSSVYVEDDSLRRRITINNVHLISGNHVAAQKMFNFFVSDCRGNYIIIGDMNIPTDIIEVPCISYLHAPNEFTQQGGKVLDYAYTSLQCELIGVDTCFRNSDHLFVVYEITI